MNCDRCQLEGARPTEGAALPVGWCSIAHYGPGNYRFILFGIILCGSCRMELHSATVAWVKRGRVVEPL